MANLEFSDFLYTDTGVAVNNATVNLYDRNTTTPVRATTTTNPSGYYTISHATEGRFDIEIVNGTSIRRYKYDAAIQILEIETANLLVRNPAFTFKYDIVPAAITADRQLNLPLITATRTLIANDTPVADDALILLGTDSDQVLLNRSTALLANTALTSVLIGVPISPALAANSLIISNATASGDILIAGNLGGNSRAYFFADVSADTVDLLTAGVSRIAIAAAGGVTISSTLIETSVSPYVARDTGVAHGFTSPMLSTNDWYYLERDSTDGGAKLYAASDAGTANGLVVRGLIGTTADPTTGKHIVLEGAKRSGASTAATGVDSIVVSIETAGTVLMQVLGDGDTLLRGGQAFRSNGATEIGILTTNGALTVGTEGSIVVPVLGAVPVDADFGNLSGAHGVDTLNNRAYWRVGTTWRYAALTSFEFPKYPDLDETICPVCHVQMHPHEGFGIWGDSFRPDGALHGYGSHLKCLPELISLVHRIEALERRAA